MVPEGIAFHSNVQGFESSVFFSGLDDYFLMAWLATDDVLVH